MVRVTAAAYERGTVDEQDRFPGIAQFARRKVFYFVPSLPRGYRTGGHVLPSTSVVFHVSNVM